MTSTLDEIGTKYGTDRSSKGNDCLSFYDLFLAGIRDREITILEVGVSDGASLKTWEEYFPKARVIGADINPAAKRLEKGRVVIEFLDRSNIEELARLGIQYGPFDIVIENGFRMWDNQITSLRTLFPFVRSGGFYIVEDLQTNYGSNRAHFKGVANASCMEYLKDLVDARVGGDCVEIEKIEDAFIRTYGHNVHFLTFCRYACLIKKNYPQVSRDPTGGTPLVSLKHIAHYQRVHISAHIASIGDVFGTSGYVDYGHDDLCIQGFSIEQPEGILEYRAFRSGASGWDDWCESGTFVGSRGQSIPLVGFAVRLKEAVKSKYTLSVYGRFAGSSEAIEVNDGRNCVFDHESPLCGIQIEIEACVDAS